MGLGLGIKLLAKAVTAAARLLDENSGETASDERVNAAIKKTRSAIKAEALLEQLNRSQVFTFEYDRKLGIVLTSCKTVYSVPNLTVPEGVKTIGEEAFKNCVFLKSIKISDTVETIGNKAFSGCTNLTDVEFSKNLKTIGSYAFNECGITKADLPDGLQKIEHRAFYECASLKSVKIPGSIRSLS
ncbi:MAG: leucine-rich repeat domain-containing protein, partial [Ruminococcus sp.]|nr:leucine-rich repeat domain-containing protein [Ruminococcus sp.]